MNHLGDWTAYWARRTPEATALVEPLERPPLELLAPRPARQPTGPRARGRARRRQRRSRRRAGAQSRRALRGALRLRQARRALRAAQLAARRRRARRHHRRRAAGGAALRSRLRRARRRRRRAGPASHRLRRAVRRRPLLRAAPRRRRATRRRRRIEVDLEDPVDPLLQLGHDRPPQGRAAVAPPARLQLAVDAPGDRGDQRATRRSSSCRCSTPAGSTAWRRRCCTTAAASSSCRASTPSARCTSPPPRRSRCTWACRRSSRCGATPNRSPRVDLSSTRMALCGGAPCPLPLIEAYRERGVLFRQGYGLTEVGPNCFSLTPEDTFRKAGSVGWPNFYLRRKIVDDAGQPVPIGEVGELALGGPMVTLGYFRNAEATAQAFRGTRLVPHRRSRAPRRRGLPLHRRPQEGHVHLRRRERLSRRGRAGARGRERRRRGRA